MTEFYSPKPLPQEVKGGRLSSCTVPVILLAAISICILCCNCAIFGNPIRAHIAAAIAKWRVERIYTQTREAAPDGVALISEEKPYSDIYVTENYDGAPLYAAVHAYQTYVTATPFNDVLENYEAAFQNWGWTVLDDKPRALSIVFRHPSEENLLVGICSPVDSGQPTAPIEYVVFFNFKEVPTCPGPYLICLSLIYCK